MVLTNRLTQPCVELKFILKRKFRPSFENVLPQILGASGKKLSIKTNKRGENVLIEVSLLASPSQCFCEKNNIKTINLTIVYDIRENLI